MNKVILMGRLTRNPDIRYSQGENQTAVAKFTLAVDRRNRRDGGDQTADFISCTAFGRTAEFFDKYVKQGTKMCVEGRIQTGSYTNREGQKVYTTDVIVENAEFAESKSASQGQQPFQSNQNQQPAQNYQSQATQHSYQEQSVPAEAASEGFMSIPDGLDDEGLPFN